MNEESLIRIEPTDVSGRRRGITFSSPYTRRNKPRGEKTHKQGKKERRSVKIREK
jgi:hypothetical protein